MQQPCLTLACRRRQTASARPSLPLSAAPEAQRWAPRVREALPARSLPPLGGHRATRGRPTRRGTGRRSRVRASYGEGCVPPRPGEDDGGAVTRRGLGQRGARPRTPHRRRAPLAPDRRCPVPVWRPRGPSAAGALRTPDVAPPPGTWVWWRAGASPRRAGTVGPRPRLRQARRARVGRAEPSTAGGRGTRGHGQPQPAPRRGGLVWESVASRGTVTAAWGPSWGGRWGAPRRRSVPGPVPNKRLHLTPGSGVRWLGTTSVAPAQVKAGVRGNRGEKLQRMS